jgi:hypothetical protein
MNIKQIQSITQIINNIKITYTLYYDELLYKRYIHEWINENLINGIIITNYWYDIYDLNNRFIKSLLSSNITNKNIKQEYIKPKWKQSKILWYDLILSLLSYIEVSNKSNLIKAMPKHIWIDLWKFKMLYCIYINKNEIEKFSNEYYNINKKCIMNKINNIFLHLYSL